MSSLRVFKDDDPHTPQQASSDHAAIAEALGARGVRFERWASAAPIAAGDPPEQVISAYQAQIDRLMAEQAYQAVDVVSLNSGHPDKAAMRRKFLEEHTHAEDEVRFFVAGQGLFSLHIGNEVCEVLCEQGDLISVPANTPHWFDMGPNPDFVAIRLFNNPEGWVAHFTGSDIAQRFNRLEN